MQVVYLYFSWLKKGCHIETTVLYGVANQVTRNKPTSRHEALCATARGADPSNWFATVSADGLVDCMDPDCCLQSSCQNQPYCRGLPDPQDIISQSLQTPSQQAAKSFYDRISFLIGSDSTHVLPGESPFNKRLMLAFLIQIHKGLENCSLHFL